MKYSLCVLFLFLSLIACGQRTSKETIIVEPYLRFENYEHFKRLILSTNFPEADFISGFDHEWGYRYELRVKVVKLESRLSDGTGYDFKLHKVLSKTRIPDSTEFNLLIDPNRYYGDEGMPEENQTIKQLTRSTFNYFDKVVIEVPIKLRADFKKIVKNNSPQMGRFCFTPEGRIKLLEIINL